MRITILGLGNYLTPIQHMKIGLSLVQIARYLIKKKSGKAEYSHAARIPFIEKIRIISFLCRLAVHTCRY